jgi:hypothetical protein
VFDVLNAATGTLKHFAQNSFAVGKWPSPNVFSVVHQKIEGESNGRRVVDPAMQRIEVRDTMVWIYRLPTRRRKSSSMLLEPKQQTIRCRYLGETYG